MPTKFSAARLQMIGAQSARWPGPNVNTAWTALHEAIAATRQRMGDVDETIAAVEDNPDLTVEAKLRRNADLALNAIAALQESRELQRARAAVESNKEVITRRRPGLRTAPTTAAEIALNAEIRQWLRSQGESASAARQHLGDSRVASAVLSAPAFLSGLSDIEYAALGDAAANAIDPEGKALTTALDQALVVAESAVVAAEAAIGERAGLTKTGDGTWRSRAPRAA